ncbi:MAG: hypothetical protein M3Y33_21335 [Actinomycetota bacterium]|nr:hypothetical protein [Actinomycetota bacterium]
MPEAILLDLSEPDLGHPDGQVILERHHRQSSRSHPEFNGGNPAFVCARHEGGTNPGLHIKKFRGQWHAAHYEKGTCTRFASPAPMSEEHRRQVDYWVRAAEDAGWPVETEAVLKTRTRPDALIRGPVPTGIEVQLSGMTRQGAVERTRRVALAGVSDVWFTSNKTEPRWAFRVPTVSENTLDWARPPPRRAATATGLRTIKPARCTFLNFDRCPASGKRLCGAYHPLARPLAGLTVDDVAARYPAGDLVALRSSQIVRRSFRTFRQDDVYIVPAACQAVYEDLTGTRTVVSFRPEAEDRPPRQPSGAQECKNLQLQLRSPDWPIIDCPGCGQPTVPGTYDPVTQQLTPAPPPCQGRCRRQLPPLPAIAARGFTASVPRPFPGPRSRYARARTRPRPRPSISARV